jgi:hypothetical protein
MKLFQIYRSPEDGGGAGGDTNAQPNGDGAGNDKGTLTQEQFNATLADRLKRDREAQQAKLLQSLGVESLDDAAAALADYKKLKDSQLSETERLQKQLDEAMTSAEQAKSEAAKAIAASNERLMKAAVIAEASKSEYGVHESARADVWLFIDREKIKANDNGDFDGVAEAIKAILEAKPYLKGEAAKQLPPGSPQRTLSRGLRTPASNGKDTPVRPTVRL